MPLTKFHLLDAFEHVYYAREWAEQHGHTNAVAQYDVYLECVAEILASAERMGQRLFETHRDIIPPQKES